MSVKTHAQALSCIWAKLNCFIILVAPMDSFVDEASTCCMSSLLAQLRIVDNVPSL